MQEFQGQIFSLPLNAVSENQRHGQRGAYLGEGHLRESEGEAGAVAGRPCRQRVTDFLAGLLYPALPAPAIDLLFE